MQLLHDRAITISVGTSRKDTNWKQQILSVGDLYERLKLPQKSPETLDEYMKLPKNQRDDLKDVGGFVGGILSGPRRKASNVISRDIVTLDLDAIPAFETDSVLAKVGALGCGYCVYSTRKHVPNAPRLRVLIPLDRSVTSEEYEAIARKLAALIGIQMADPTTFEAHRMMYWGSVCSDGEYVFKTADEDLCPADVILGAYTDWRDWNEWPQVPGAISYKKLAVKQGDPESKPGTVGAFCRTYSCRDAIDKFLLGIYTPVDNDPNRLTYAGGSTTGGAILYDNDRFLYSHHATDPCSGKLVNAFDLVRLHKFADEDDSVPFGTPPNRLPSYAKMCELASADEAVSSLIAQERAAQILADFSPLVPGGSNAGNEDGDAEAATQDAEKPDMSWMVKLQTHPKTNAVLPTIDNMTVILANDPKLKGKFAQNAFAGRGEVLGSLPWAADGKRRLWTDTDSDGLYWYIEKAYNVSNRGAIDSALAIHMEVNAFNEVQDYIHGLTWDGTPRLDTLFCDFLGAEDNEYTRAVCRKSFVAAIKRAMEPGCKYDNMVILCGPQGIGKSTILDKMSKGWFNDSIRTFEGKEASELLPGVWLVEVAELDAFKRSDVSRIKQFLSLRADRYRAAYGRHMSELPRCCVFFGTCNQMEFLQDTTGNRRFLPVDVGGPHPLTVWEDLTDDYIDQVWAEAKTRWQFGEGLFLTGELERMANARQEEHREASPREGAVLEFISAQIPVDWDDWSIDKRRDFWAGNCLEKVPLKDRETVCTVEIWVELFGKNRADMKRSDSREIADIISHSGDWIILNDNKAVKWGPYGKERGWKKAVKRG